MATTTKTSLGLDLIDVTTERLEESRIKISQNFALIEDLFKSDVFDTRYYTQTETDELLASMTDKMGDPIASATITTVGTAGLGDTIPITLDITPINSLGISLTGVKRTLVFNGIITLTHNATSFILPTSANIVTAVGDIAEFQCEDGTNAHWRCLSYTRKSGQPLIVPTYAVNGVTIGSNTILEERIGTIASASTMTIGSAGLAENLNVTGIVTVLSLGLCLAGVKRKLLFGGSLTLTHNAVSLILPNGKNIITETGDIAEFTCVSDNNWKLTNFVRNSNSLASTQLFLSTSSPSGGKHGDVWMKYI